MTTIAIGWIVLGYAVSLVVAGFVAVAVDLHGQKRLAKVRADLSRHLKPVLEHSHRSI